MPVSDFLLAPTIAWIISQLVKYVIASRVTGKYGDFRILLQSGSMPSVHTAIVTALVVIVGIGVGFNSPLFAATLIFGTIIAYDAMQVRRATGEQGTVIQELVTIAKLKLAQPTYQAKGHRPREVAVGALIGLLSALLLYFV